MQSDTELWKYITKPRSEDGLDIVSACFMGTQSSNSAACHTNCFLFQSDDERAFEEITSLFASHVSGIKKIYESTVFENGADRFTGFTFVVRRVKVSILSCVFCEHEYPWGLNKKLNTCLLRQINTTEDCEGGKEQTNLFCKPNIDVSNFLNLNSLENHDQYCLAYLFTYRDFTAGTLGLAWVGSPTSQSLSHAYSTHVSSVTSDDSFCTCRGIWWNLREIQRVHWEWSAHQQESQYRSGHSGQLQFQGAPQGHHSDLCPWSWS